MNVQGGVEGQLVRGITSAVAHGVPCTCCCCFVPGRACAVHVLGDLFTCSTHAQISCSMLDRETDSRHANIGMFYLTWQRTST